jgi:hypothetical protein
MKTYSTFLPVFSGFYSNPNFDLDFEREINYIHEYRDENKLTVIKDIDLDVDYKEFNQDVSKSLCDYIQDEFNQESETKISIKFEKLVSPSYYNYENDAIDCEIECDVNVLLSICNKNLEAFTQYISDNYTSCSGFISSYSNDVNDWLNVEYIEQNSKHCIGAILNFICKDVYEISEPNLYDLDICDSNYFTNVEYWQELNLICQTWLKFDSEENFDKCISYLTNWSGLHDTWLEFRTDLIIKFYQNDFEHIENDLLYSPLIDFSYKFE